MFSTSVRSRRSPARSAASFAFSSVTSADTETVPPPSVRHSVIRKQRPSASVLEPPALPVAPGGLPPGPSPGASGRAAGKVGQEARVGDARPWQVLVAGEEGLGIPAVAEHEPFVGVE